MKLHSMNLGGNLHSAVSYVDKVGLVPYLFSLHSVSGHGSIAVFKFENEQTYNYYKDKKII